MRKTVYKSFRDLVKHEFPGLGNNQAYWAFMRYLMFTTFREENGAIIIPRERLAKCEGKINPETFEIIDSKKYCGEDFLNKFCNEVFNGDGIRFNWSNSWNFKEGKSRVAFVNWGAKIQEALDNEIYKICMDGDERVYFETGKKFSTKLQKVDREVAKLEANTYFNFAAEEAKPVLDYMNTLPVTPFTKIVEANFNAALIVAAQLKDDTGHKRRVNMEVLNTILDDLQPFYQGSKNHKTVRVFPINISIPMLARNVRKALCKGWWEADLRSSQLAIAAKIWGIPEVEEFLKSGNSIWTELLTYHGLAHLVKGSAEYETSKKALKDNLYSLLFGAAKSTIVSDLDERLGKGQGKLFFSHSLIKILYKARQKRMSWLNQEGKLTTIFGKVVEITGSKDEDGNPSGNRSASIRSALAQEAQAIELWLMLPLIDLAKGTKDFQITLWQHDGVSINFTDSSKQNRWIKKMVKVVDERAKELGVMTELELEELK